MSVCVLVGGRLMYERSPTREDVDFTEAGWQLVYISFTRVIRNTSVSSLLPGCPVRGAEGAGGGWGNMWWLGGWLGGWVKLVRGRVGESCA